MIKSTPEAKLKQSLATKDYFSNQQNRKKASELKKQWHSIPKNKERFKKQNTGLNNPQSDKTKYHFLNRKTGNREFCSRYELRINPNYLHENLSQSGIAQLCLKKFSSYKNWIIDK